MTIPATIVNQFDAAHHGAHQIGEAARRDYSLRRPPTRRGGWIHLTIFTNARRNTEIVKEEISGPIVIKFEDEDEALRQANDTQYTLALLFIPLYLYASPAGRR